MWLDGPGEHPDTMRRAEQTLDALGIRRRGEATR
jgi:hypothetical protein